MVDKIQSDTVVDTFITDGQRLSPDERKKGINLGWLSAYMLTITLGMF